MILEKLTQLHDEFRMLEKPKTIEAARTTASTEQTSKLLPGDPLPSSQGDPDISVREPLKSGRHWEATQHLPPVTNIGQRLTPTKPLPTSSILRWKTVHDLHPTVANHYIHDDLTCAYSAIGAPPIQPSATMTQTSNEHGQDFFYIRIFLDLVYPLYPLICERAVYDIATVVIRDGVQHNIKSVLVLLMRTLGKLYSRTYNLIEHTHLIADLDNAVRVLNWLPLRHDLEYAQAYTLAALCFAKLSMLSTCAFYLRQGSANLYPFLAEFVCPPLPAPITCSDIQIGRYSSHRPSSLAPARLRSGFTG